MFALFMSFVLPLIISLLTNDIYFISSLTDYTSYPENKPLPPLPIDKPLPELPIDTKLPEVPIDKKLPELPIDKDLPELIDDDSSTYGLE